MPTTWYNYMVASAGTIKNTNATDYLSNTEKATESICPKGWALPTTEQIDVNRNLTNFSPVSGGIYGYGAPYNESTRGGWWGSEAYNGAVRYVLDYDADRLYTGIYNGRATGFYIRCVPAP